MTGMAAPQALKLPVGEVILIQFTTAFQNMPAAVETVSPPQEQDGSRKVSGYYIRPAPNP